MGKSERIKLYCSHTFDLYLVTHLDPFIARERLRFFPFYPLVIDQLQGLCINIIGDSKIKSSIIQHHLNCRVNDIGSRYFKPKLFEIVAEIVELLLFYIIIDENLASFGIRHGIIRENAGVSAVAGRFIRSRQRLRVHQRRKK